jgi:superfamily II DNA or RNA helicase
MEAEMQLEAIQTAIAGRKWQQDALNILFRKIAREEKNALMVACPGAGKTRLALATALEMRQRGLINKVIVVAPTDNLRVQWVHEMHDTAGITAVAGTVPGDTQAEWKAFSIQEAYVYTYQTLNGAEETIKRLVKENEVLVLVDEVHHAGEALPWHTGLIKAFKERVFGMVLSGTPWRSDGRPMPFVETDEYGFAIPDYTYSRRNALVDKKVVRELVFTPVTAFVHVKETKGLMNRQSKETIWEDGSFGQSSGWTSQWDYGAMLVQANPSEPVLRAKLQGMIRESMNAPALTFHSMTEAKEYLEGLSDAVKKSKAKLHTKEREVVRKTQNKDLSTAYTIYPMHKPYKESTMRYKASISPGSESSALLLKEAHEKLMAIRETDKRAGALVVCDSQQSAREYALFLEELTGEKPDLVISDAEENMESSANKKIEDFRNSDRKWIVTVKMVSEGVDIKRLRVLAYLSNVLSELFLSQVVGRVTRWRDDLEEGVDQTAYAFIMSYPPLEDLAALVDGKVVGRTSEFKMPPIPAGPKTCLEPGNDPKRDPKLWEFSTPLQRGCRAINSGSATECHHCKAPFSVLVRTMSEKDINGEGRRGVIWRGITATESNVERGWSMWHEDDDLAGIAPEIIASIISRYGEKSAKEKAFAMGL